MSVVTTYNIELRSKGGALKTYLTPFVSKVTWEWNRMGGCGRCSITLKKGYREIDFAGRDDIQIRIKSGSTSKLVYRGFLANIVPALKIDQDVKLDVRGYFDLLKALVIQSSGDTKTYTSNTIAVIVDDIVDNFIVANSDITKGTIDTADGSAFLCDTIDFLGTVDDGLRTLAELAGDVEYGVDEDLVFFWRTESTTINNRLFVGNNISLLERRVNWDSIVNKIYLIGGDVAGSAYKKTGEAVDSQTTYGLYELILNNSSITTSGVANQLLTSILSEKSTPKFSIRAKILNTALRIEDTIPLGLITFFDVAYDTGAAIIGETGDGGDDITIGTLEDGGSGIYVGGEYSGQIDRIAYSISDTDERFNLNIQLGDSILETAAKIKRLELKLASLEQGA